MSTTPDTSNHSTPEVNMIAMLKADHDVVKGLDVFKISNCETGLG